MVYTLTVESPADVHFSRVTPPRADGTQVRRYGQEHDYQFVGNKEFRRSTYRFLVSAERTGSITLQGASLAHIAVADNGDRRQVEHQPVPVTFNSLPVPDNYRGLWLPSTLVTLEQQWSSPALTLQAGESITRELTLFIEGRNIDSFPELAATYPDTANVYNEQPQFEERDGGTRMTLRQVVVPRAEGELVIPGIAIPWFDLTSNEMQIASVGSLTLDIIANQGQALALAAPAAAPGMTAGYWPFLTAAVTVFWLLTLFLLLTSRKAQELKPDHSVKATDHCLQTALKENNPQAVVRAWQHAGRMLSISAGRRWIATSGLFTVPSRQMGSANAMRCWRK